MGRLVCNIRRWVCLGPALVLILASGASAQGLGNNRLGMNQLVRGLLLEEVTAYLPDTTLNRFINYAHREVKTVLGGKTAIVFDTVITTTGVIRYTLTPANASSVSGRVSLVVLKESDLQGGEQHALQEVPPEIIGKTGESTEPGTYAMLGQTLVLGKSPQGGDTLFVYLTTVATDLSADGTALEVAEEDELALAWLASALVLMRDKQYEGAQSMVELYRMHISSKMTATQGAPSQ